ncbi:c-type heme family protein [Winogradskyella sp.]|uniref:c-type heme family protein n=1 Tax=Winogradskyella sp. TaxID=1883156 RepID=UPI003F6BCE87
MRQVLLIALASVLILSCNDSKKQNLSAYEIQMQANKHPGKKLMETNCYVCHSPTAGHDDRIGPPMIAIKKHYINDETTKEEFIAELQAWIKNPNETDAKMRGAVRRFGVMPKQAFSEETIKQIADYMFDYEIEQPEWFEDHFNEEQGKGMGKGKGMGNGHGKGKGKHQQQASTNIDDLPYVERGLKYALTTKAVLGKNLMGTIQKKGTLEALSFCNERAYPLTDSMSVVHNAVIKRVSDKPRNQKNRANTEELEFINTFKQQLANQLEIQPIVKESEDNVPEQDIRPEVINRLTTLYSNDKATGYSVGQVRGIWNVTFSK